ncbi:MAG: hypothetical protein PUB08_07425, partial [Firmicutes bacterium]|nr:hypothetical protein [Bacillota bacterium]
AELNDRSLFDSIDERAEMTPGVQQEINLGSERPVKALRQLKTDISEAFNIRDGYKRDMGRILEGVSKTMLDGGKLSDSDIDSLLDSVIAASDVPYVNEELAGIQQEIKGAKIKINQQVKSDISDYDALRKSLNGLVVLTGGKGRALDTYYAELNSMFGEGYFPSEVTDGAEQLKIIADIMLKDSNVHRSLEAAAYDEGGDDGMDAARAQARRDLVDILKNYEISANRELRGYAEDKAGKYERQIERANDTKQRRRQKVENAINEVEDYRDKNQVELDSRDGSDKEAWMNLHRAIRENSKYLSYYERQLTADEKEQLKLALEKRILPSVMEMPEGEGLQGLFDAVRAYKNR